jgi:glycosyltransferase involved in cell wall biosynthesis
MKIVMNDPSLFTGRYDDSLCAALAELGHSVTLMGRPPRLTDAIAPKAYMLAPRFFKTSERMRGLLGDGLLFKVLKGGEYWLDSRIGPLDAMAAADVVHIQWAPLPNVDAHWLRRLRALDRRKRPALIHTVHNANALHGEQRAAAYTKLLRLFDRLIVHGDETRAALRAQGIADELMSNVSHPPMQLASADTVTLSAVPDPQCPRLLFFGTIRPYKGFDLLVQACLELWRAGAKFELAVAGKAFMEIDSLMEQVRDAGFGDRLILDLGFLREQQLDAHLRKADIIVFPYREIDSSGAFLSALHYGRAMVCTRVGMFATLASAAQGKTPIMVCESESATALVAVIGRLIADPALRREMGQRAAALGAQLGGWDRAAEASLTVYRAALAQVRGGEKAEVAC